MQVNLSKLLTSAVTLTLTFELDIGRLATPAVWWMFYSIHLSVFEPVRDWPKDRRLTASSNPFITLDTNSVHNDAADRCMLKHNLSCVGNKWLHIIILCLHLPAEIFTAISVASEFDIVHTTPATYASRLNVKHSSSSDKRITQSQHTRHVQ